MWLAELKICPKGDPSEGCDWPSRRFVRKMIRPKDVIGWADDSSERWSVQRMWLAELTIRPKDDPSEGCDWLSQINLSVWQGVRLVVLPDESDWTRREPCLFFVNATDWTVRWTCPAKGASDWPIRRSAFSVFFGILSHAMLDMQTRWGESDYAKASSLGDEYAVLICSWRENRQNEHHLVLLTLPVVEYIYCALCSLIDVGKCVCCSCVVLMSTCSEYYD